MRLIDADALKELFREVIGHIAKKPEMNGNLEHMIRASAMVIQMIDDAPTVQPDTTTHDSIPAETGKNYGDRTSGDCISRQQAIDALKSRKTAEQSNAGIMRNAVVDFCIGIVKKLPSVQPERPKGEWIHQAKFSRVECDQCGKVFRNTFAPKNFCPNCGADMRGDSE